MQHSLTYQNTAINYHKFGQGKPVLLLHGFGEDSTIWNEQIKALQSECMLIVPDLPRSGLSGLLMPRGNETIGIQDYADCIYALLLHEEVEMCTVLGHSMGGYITLAFAHKYPAMVEAFGLIHSTAFADNDEKKAGRRKSIESIEKNGSYGFLQNMLPGLFADTFKQQQPEKVALLVDRSHQFTPEALVQYLTAMMHRPDLTSVLAESKVPVLFIIGEEDKAAPLVDLLQQVHLPALSHIHILKNVAHMGMWEATELVNNYLLDFIKARV